MALTPKQEKFCQEYKNTGSKSEAYRRAYNSEKMKPATINRKSFDIFNKDKIRARIAELEKEAEKEFKFSFNKSIQYDLDLIEKYRKCINILENDSSDEEEIKIARRTMHFIGVKAYNGAMDRIAKKLGHFEKDNSQKAHRITGNEINIEDATPQQLEALAALTGIKK